MFCRYSTMTESVRVEMARAVGLGKSQKALVERKPPSLRLVCSAVRVFLTWPNSSQTE